MKLVFTKAARQDLDRIAEHIATDNVDAALRLIAEIEARARLLTVTPSNLQTTAGYTHVAIEKLVAGYERTHPRAARPSAAIQPETTSTEST